MSLITKLGFIGGPSAGPSLKGVDIDLHDHLAEDADWGAEHWDFDPEHLQRYAETLERLVLLSNNGIEFQADWIGDIAKNVIELPLRDFLEIVKSNKIGTKTKYIVRKNA